MKYIKVRVSGYLNQHKRIYTQLLDGVVSWRMPEYSCSDVFPREPCLWCHTGNSFLAVFSKFVVIISDSEEKTFKR